MNDTPKTAADIHAEQTQKMKFRTEAAVQVGAKMRAMEQAVRVVQSPGYTGDRNDVMTLAREVYAFMVEA